MARTTPAEVKQITGSDLPDEQVWPFIDAAHALINAASTCANVSEDILTQAETWLAAHLTTIANGGGGVGNATKESQSIESMSVTYAVSSSTGQGLLSTHYGQVANTLMNGCLADLSKQRATIFFSGGA